jgi:chaperonin GroES
MTLGGGDQLARGAVKAQFPVPNVSEDKWKEMFGGDNGFEERMRKKALSEGLSEEQYEQAKQEAAKQIQEIEQRQQQEQEEQQAKIKFRAVLDRIVVQRLEEEEKVGKFYLPDEAKEKPYKGIVIAVGPGKYVDGDLQKPSIEVGEKVVFGKFSGAEAKIGFQTYLILREEDIFIVEETGE